MSGVAELRELADRLEKDRSIVVGAPGQRSASWVSVEETVQALRGAAEVIEAAGIFMEDALAAPLNETTGFRHYDLAHHGGPVGDLFRLLLEGPRGPHGLPHIKSDQDGGDPSKEARPHDQNDDPSEQPQEP